MSKYYNKKTEYNGILFDSKKEAERYAELKLLEKAGEIKFLERQKRFKLIPAQYGDDGKMIERECTYVADFVYEERNGDKWETVIEDVKGTKTDVYKIKKKMMLYFCGIQIRET